MVYKKLWLNLWVFAVTTFAVVWIEITAGRFSIWAFIVTTFAVVWIEINNTAEMEAQSKSPPSRWCGLKFEEKGKSA